MRVLIACEFSGVVRDAFLRRGFDAVSCDLLPTERPGPHIQGDVAPLLEEAWDLIVAHPPCTYLCNSGVRWLHENNPPDRWQLLADASEFFLSFWYADCGRVAIENPTMHMYAKDLVGIRPQFCVHPYHFGHPESKRTCFWTRGLPPLMATNVVANPKVANKVWMMNLPPGEERWRRRSETFEGIAEAMADQWGSYIRGES